MKPLRALSLLLAMMLSLSIPVGAYGSENLVPQKRVFKDAFTDIRETPYEAAVQTCYEAGLMEGKSAASFAPHAPLTYAQIIVITARLHELLHGGDGQFDPPGDQEAWYQPAADYLIQQLETDTAPSALLSDLFSLDIFANQNCRRADFAWYLSAVLPDTALAKINEIHALPDTTDEDVLRLYNAGVLTGSDPYGTFHGEQSLSRGQAAMMLARVIDPAQRVAFTPKTIVYAQHLLGLPPETTLMTVDGYPVSADLYTYFLMQNISLLEIEHYLSFYETYPQEFQDYLADMDFKDDFGAYLREKKGIDIHAPIDWTAPDRGGMTLSKKAEIATRNDVLRVAVLLNHQKEYPLTQDQQAALSTTGSHYGFTNALVKTLSTSYYLAENIMDSISLTPSQLNDYLKQSGYIYGRPVVIYRGAEGLYESDDEARRAAQTVQTQMAAHRSDTDYLEFLIWKYSDDDGADPQLFPLTGLSYENRQLLERLEMGQVSPVLAEEDRYLVILKLDPSQDDSISQNAANMAIMSEKIEAWCKEAKILQAETYAHLDIAGACSRYSAMNG